MMFYRSHSLADQPHTTLVFSDLSDTKTEQEKTTMALIWVQYLAQHHTNTSTIWTPNPFRSHRSQAATAQHHEIVPGDVTRAPARGYNR